MATARLVENLKKAVMFQSENRTAEAFYLLSLFVSDTLMIYWILKLLQLVSVCYTYRSKGGSDKQILSDLEHTETIVVVLPDSFWFWGPWPSPAGPEAAHPWGKPLANPVTGRQPFDFAMADVVAPAPVGDGAMRTELQELQMQANVITDEVSVCGLCFFCFFAFFWCVCVCVYVGFVLLFKWTLVVQCLLHSVCVWIPSMYCMLRVGKGWVGGSTHTRMHARTHVCMHTHMPTHTHARTRAHACMHT